MQLRDSLKRGASFVLLNFATPIVFFWTFRAKGAKTAIAFALAVTWLQVLAHLVRRIRFSPFFIVASGFTVLFGTMDLFIDQPRYFRLEPFAHNLIVGMAFGMSVMMNRPILSWFAADLPVWARPDLDREGQAYLRKLTWVWTIYLLMKAFFFLYLAFEVDLGTLIVLRSIVGGGTLAIMALGEVAYRKWLRKH